MWAMDKQVPNSTSTNGCVPQAHKSRSSGRARILLIRLIWLQYIGMMTVTPCSIKYKKAYRFWSLVYSDALTRHLVLRQPCWLFQRGVSLKTVNLNTDVSTNKFGNNFEIELLVRKVAALIDSIALTLTRFRHLLIWLWIEFELHLRYFFRQQL